MRTPAPSVLAALNNCVKLRMRSTPARRIAASNTSSPPTSEPVWKARLPRASSERPAFITTTGLTRAAARSALMKRRACCTPSMYSTMPSVTGSRARKSSTSPKPTSSPTPVEITVENPTRRARAQSSVAAQTALDCETRASRPASGSAVPQAALSCRSGRIRPKLFGPSSRRPCRAATASIACSSAAPCSPPSRKPAETTTAPLTPRRPQSSSTCGTVAAGVAMIARSTACGRAATSG